MEKSKDKNPQNLEAELFKCTTLCEYERAIKIANKILQKNPNDVATFECKAICLLQINQFEEALRLTNNNSKLSQGLHFERAYCFYRLNKTEEALKVLEEIPLHTHGVKELKAQILYRLDRHLDAFNEYEKIFREVSDDEYDEERQTNLCAVASFLENSDEYENHLKEDTYEMCFNKACMHARHENYQDADRLLKKSEKLLKETFEEEDGTNDEDFESEVAHIRILQAYCYQKQNRTKEAHQIYLNTLKLNIDDATLNAVISNNIVVINKDQNVFDSKKKMRTAINETVLLKLPTEQRKRIVLNNAIFNYITHQYENVRKMCINLVETEWPIEGRLLSVLSQSKLNPKLDAVEELLKYKTKLDNEDMFMKLVCVQLLLNEGKTIKACQILEDLGCNYRYKPGIVGALITLYLSMGKEDIALRIYEASIEWYKSNEKSGMNLTHFFQQAAEFHIRSGRPEVAAKSLEQLLVQKSKDDSKTLSQLIIAYSQFNNKKVLELGKELGGTNEIGKDVDIENLENAIWLAKKTTVITAKDSSPRVQVEVKKKKSRKRSGKKPKNYDATVVPDPERWLPKYERTGYRKKRDRRTKDVIIKGSQGTASGQSEQFDYSKMVVDSDDNPGSVEPSPMPKNNSNKKNVQNKKKKNKRR